MPNISFCFWPTLVVGKQNLIWISPVWMHPKKCWFCLHGRWSLKMVPLMLWWNVEWHNISDYREGRCRCILHVFFVFLSLPWETALCFLKDICSWKLECGRYFTCLAVTNHFVLHWLLQWRQWRSAGTRFKLCHLGGWTVFWEPRGPEFLIHPQEL